MKRICSIMLIVAAALPIAGCSGDDDDPVPAAASYRGELRIDFSPLVVGEQWVDTIFFTVNNGIYSITHLSSNGNPSSLCDSEGEIGGFNTNQVRLTPQSYFGGNCSQRGPSGEFTAQFAGDSLRLDNIDQTDAVFQFRLVRSGGSGSSLYPTR
ncbi:MAG: hypothetical protein RBT76_00430 [candidate division Zixibacteria bacterium]|nr:hypothetical protein [candidate division Zixibacteria bacterium]